MSNHFFDLHTHPLFKQYLSKYEENTTERSVDELQRDIYLSSGLVRLVDEEFLHILNSQASIEQMIDGKLSLSVASFVALEYGIANSRGFIGKILRSKFTRPLDKTYFYKVINGEISYYRLFLQELYLYKYLADGTRKSENPVVILSRKSKNSSTDSLDDKSIYFVLSLEGGHNLCRDLIGKPGVIDDAEINNTTLKEITKDFNNKNELYNAAHSLKRLMNALWEDGLDILYLTLTHLTHIPQQLLATHAFGLKLLKHVAFYPQGSGITEMGKEVIKTAYTLKKGDQKRPVLIDIKHMSLQSRLEFYEYRKELKASIKNLPPILATHMGVTGYSIEEWKEAKINAATYLKSEDDAVISVTQVVTERRLAGRWGSLLNNEFTFNPWSINLMDEDIEEILKSGGLIGISLDIRILGFQQKFGFSSKKQPEYFSPPEFKKLFGLSVRNDNPIDELTEEESWVVPTKYERQPIAFCFNIIHVLAVAKYAGVKEAWRQICIGSDFDGLIDPVKNCADSSKLGELERLMIKWLPVAAQAYVEEHAFVDRLFEGKIEEIVRCILYENGKSFLNKQGWV